MKKHLIFSCLILLYFGASASIISSELKGARVFLWGAEISRTASATVNAGVTELVFSGLPADIDPNSIQVKAVGNFTILSVGHRNNYLELPQLRTQVQLLTDSLEYYTREIELQQAMLKIYEEEESLLLSNKNLGGTDTGVKVADLRAMADFYRSRLEEIKKLQLATKAVIESLKIRQSQIRHQIGQLGRDRAYVSEIVVNTMATSNVRGQFELSYITRQANWVANYDIRVSDTDKPVELMMKASVSQNTGEDWNNINLTLSTANVLDSRVVPSLETWFLRFIEPLPMIQQSRSLMKMDAEIALEMIIADDLLDEEQVMGYGRPMVVATETTTTREYQIVTPHNIKSGLESQMVEVQKEELPASYSWYAVPRVERDVFLVARISGWEKLVVLPGEAGIFFENAYVGKTFIDPMLTTDTLEVSLGADRGVTVERERMADFSRKSILGRRTTETVAWEIKGRNNKSRSINLEIRDQIPVSTHNDIQISLEESTGAEYVQETGMLKWRLLLDAGQGIQLPFRYSVRYPSDKKLRLE